MADKQQESVSDAAEQAQEQGYLGTVHDEIENEAYTVQGQGPETAKREREQHRSLRTKFEDASVEGDDTSSKQSSSKSSKRSSGSSSSSSSDT